GPADCRVRAENAHLNHPDQSSGREPGGAQRVLWAYRRPTDRKSTRLNSSHVKSSYAVFCLKKKFFLIVQNLIHYFRFSVNRLLLFIIDILLRRLPFSTLFPYTTLFRSGPADCRVRAENAHLNHPDQSSGREPGGAQRVLWAYRRP